MQIGYRVSVLIADDYPVIREGLTAILKSQPRMKVVSECGTWPTAIKQIVHLRPNVALVDLHMPGGDAPAGISIIRTKFDNAKIVVFSDFDTDEEVYQCIRAGANGYLPKSETDREDLLRCIHGVLMGQVWIHPSSATRLAERMNSPVLTKREKDVLKMMVAGSSNKEIGNALKVTEGTVKVHLNHVFAKLGVTGRVSAVSAAVQYGLVALSQSSSRSKGEAVYSRSGR